MQNKTFIGLAALLITIAVLLSFAPWTEAYIETFNSDEAGWQNYTVTDGGNTAATSSPWSSSGGNPDGHVTGYVDDAQDSTRLYGIQAQYGDGFDVFGDLTGQTLTVDYKIDGSVTGPVGAKVRFFVGYWNQESRYWVSNDSFSWDPNSDTAWTTHTVSVDESNFILWPNQNAGDTAFGDVIGGLYNDIGLVFADGFTNNSTLGFSSTDGATIHVDNFGAVPIPGAVLLFGTGLLGFAGVRTKRKFKK